MNAVIFIMGALLIIGSVAYYILRMSAYEKMKRIWKINNERNRREGREETELEFTRPKSRLTILLVLVGIIVIITSSCFVIIPTGYTGVKSTFGQISAETLQNGFNLKLPYVQKIEKVNNKQQDIEFLETDIWSETSERTAICYSGITVTYQISKDKSAWIYANVSSYKDNLVSQSLVSSAIKSSSKRLEDVDATDRSKIEAKAQEMIQLSLDEKYGEDTVLVNKVVIESANFDDEYDAAIAATQKAEQAAKTQAIENEKAIAKAEADATVVVTAAQAEADAKLIEARSTAEANKLLEKSLTENVLLDNMISKWDGKMPSVVSDAQSMFSLDSFITD